MTFTNAGYVRILEGAGQIHFRRLEETMHVEIKSSRGVVTISGAEKRVAEAEGVIRALYGLAKREQRLTLEDVDEIVRRGTDSEDVAFSHGSQRIVARTDNQRRYLSAVKRHDVVFGVGPAGTGKTYLAMALAANALLKKEVKRIVLVRPAVEAGEKLGFLPGDMAEKVNPYLRPLYDALYDMVDIERAQAWIAQGTIEVAPLAFMRGRTLNQSFIILDEAQNTTREQMKMFLTRLGNASKVIVTGDLTQTDLGDNVCSGLSHALQILEGVEGVEVVRLGKRDIVRHPLVQRIVEAYERSEK